MLVQGFAGCRGLLFVSWIAPGNFVLIRRTTGVPAIQSAFIPNARNRARAKPDSCDFNGRLEGGRLTQLEQIENMHSTPLTLRKTAACPPIDNPTLRMMAAWKPPWIRR